MNRLDNHWMISLKIFPNDKNKSKNDILGVQYEGDYKLLHSSLADTL